MARAKTALAAVSSVVSPMNPVRLRALLRGRMTARGLPGTPSTPVLRVARAAVFSAASATAAIGGFALAGFDPSIATAPLQTDSAVESSAGEQFDSLLRATPTPEWPPEEELFPEPVEPVDADPDKGDDEAAGATGESGAAEGFVYSGGRLSEAEVRALARQAGWPESTLNELVQVAWCESRYDPAATNGPAISGLMQLHRMWFDYAGTDLGLWSDPLVNLRVARAVYQYDIDRGHAPWTQWECKPNGYASNAPTMGDDGQAHGASEGAGAEPTATPAPATPTPDATPQAEPTPTEPPAAPTEVPATADPTVAATSTPTPLTPPEPPTHGGEDE